MKKYLIQKTPFVVPTTDGKLIEEHHGIPTTGNKNISIAHMNHFKLQSLKNTLILFLEKSNL
jgi:hypothetical protein